ncbi:hypothetical protein C8Q75DRAFT_574332, partial [Abortiporus biennis]
RVGSSRLSVSNSPNATTYPIIGYRPVYSLNTRNVIQQVLNYSDNIFLTVTVSQELAQQPSGLVIHPSLTTLGQVGELRDVQLVSVPEVNGILCITK